MRPASSRQIRVAPAGEGQFRLTDIRRRDRDRVGILLRLRSERTGWFGPYLCFMSGERGEGYFSLVLAFAFFAFGMVSVLTGSVGPGVLWLVIGPAYAAQWYVRRRPGPTPRWARPWKFGGQPTKRD
jgi:hypothetical protein